MLVKCSEYDLGKLIVQLSRYVTGYKTQVAWQVGTPIKSSWQDSAAQLKFYNGYLGWVSETDGAGTWE